ncbi:geranyltranstransferase [Hyphomonas adhaerens MHS-3]|jgi:farnesyl diphosphate synthase|uniref:Geranyltranstransferase n=2 Tax=Hyphomonas adhaerens TaxID=81029 RepID=A0A069E0Y7_9PROT|nr:MULTISPECIES: farnesyl diphosphate synthase [Hyphomonas]KCZ82976.1 geranyltranstransferase [Hyphomonas adhaerens MHS-3]MBB39120.1 polyprenyl synthetase family protein [Hyphomonas sp.]|tara:strand:+ start:1156 stop:2052 length:897 start_codon:yes stop_codon:yes gene_type:complete
MGEVIDFDLRLKEVADKVTVALDQLIPPASGPEADLMRAMRHAALANGKRMRPFFLLEAGAMFDAPEKSLLRAAAALECVHCYSLVHDDLPCMDDDDFRRGQPTVHKAFDEATAVLAGDALLTLAFKILSSRETHPDAEVRARLIERLADSAGARGMVGGQMIDMLESESPRDLNTITRMQRLKTGALISYATEAAGIIGHAHEQERSALAGFSNDLGLAYQIADDLLDATGDEQAVGKALAKDENAGKANFVTILGIDGARQRVQLLADQAKEHLAIFREKANILLQSVDFVLDRTH